MLLVLALVVAIDAGCLIDLIRARVRHLPKWAWALIILIQFPLGVTAYLVLGRDWTKPAVPDSKPSAAGPGPAYALPRRRKADPVVIEVDRLTKRFGSVTAVDDLSFTVRPGMVTGFLGPNGAGKTTTLRVILGLNAPTSGRALVAGQRYDGLIRPLREVGSLLDATALHPGRTARAHLQSMAQS